MRLKELRNFDERFRGGWAEGFAWQLHIHCSEIKDLGVHGFAAAANRETSREKFAHSEPNSLWLNVATSAMRQNAPAFPS
jgi:hypothetical protein